MCARPHYLGLCRVEALPWPLAGSANARHGLARSQDKRGYGHKAMLCGGLVPMSPCPCCIYCGFGPCAAEWHFVRDPADATKWNATGSVFACQACETCTNHAGDTFVIDAEHDGTFEKPLEMHAGMNPVNPPCIAGKKALKFYMVSDRKGTRGGAPETAAMER